VISAAIFVRAAYLVQHLRSPLRDIFRLDQQYYHDWALRIANGDLRGEGVFEQGPLYAYLLGGFYRLIGPRDGWILALQFGCGVLTAVLVWAGARRVFGAPAGLAAGLLAALYGPFLVHEGTIMKSFLEPLLVMAALWAGLRALEEDRARWRLLAGLAVGLACLVREAHVLLLVPLAAVLWRGASARRLLPLAAGFLLPLMPVTARNCLVAGECTLVTAGGGEVFYIGFGPYADGFYAIPDFVRPLPHLEHEDFREEARLRAGRLLSRSEVSRFWYQEGLRALTESPGRTAGLLVRKAAILFNDFEVPDSEQFVVMKDYLPLLHVLPGFGLLFGLGLIGIGLSVPWHRRASLVLGFAAALVLQILLTYNFARFRLALAAVWMGFCGKALVELVTTWRRGGSSRYGALAGCALAVLGSVIAFIPPPGLDPDRRAWEEERYREEVRKAAEARDALPVLRRAAAELPGQAAPHLALARALAATGRMVEADAAWREALRAEPEDAELFLEHVGLLLREGRLADAEAEGLARSRLQPRAPESLRAMAMIWDARAAAAPRTLAPEYLRRAREVLIEILRRSPGDVEALFRYGRLSYLAGERVAAHGALSAAREIDPGHVGAARVLWYLERKNE
jgi:4-amino-4-deoxy-L-arabinose transferase-like glycosyltransferase